MPFSEKYIIKTFYESPFIYKPFIYSMEVGKVKLKAT